MSTKSIHAETLIAGFSLLSVIILFVLLRISDNELFDTIKYFNSLSGGASAILLTIVFGLSYTLGSLSHRIGADLSELYYFLPGTEKPKNNIHSITDELILENYFNKWLVKSFYRTLMISSPFISGELILLDNRLSSGQHFWTILIIGIVLEVVFVTAFITQRRDSNKNTDNKNESFI